MSRVTSIQTNFTAGQLSPRLFGRVDLNKYANGAAEITNLIVQPHGGVTRRPGTKFINEVKTSSAKTRLLPFEFSTIQAYCVEAGDQYLRFFKDQGVILEANKTVSAITKANPGVVTATSHGFDNGDLVFISSVVGMTEVNSKYFKVANKGTNTFELQDVDGNNVNTSGFTTYSSGGTAARVVQVTSPYATADLFSIQYAQTADVMYLVHPTYAPRKLSRTSHTDWTLTEVDLQDGPYLDENITTTTLDSDGTTGDVTITASAVTGINGGSGFLATDVGRLIRIGHQATEWAASTSFSVGDIRRNSGNVYECIKAGTSAGSGGPSGELDSIVDNTVTWKFIDDGGIHHGNAKITAVNSTTEVDATVSKNFAAHTAETKWRLGAFSGTTGYPSAVAFFEQRLFFAGTTDQPQTIFASRSGDFENFAPSALDDGAITVTIATDQVNSIRWLSPGQKMAIGTAGGEFTFSSSGNEEAVTPTNLRVLRQGTRGVHTTRPVRIDNRVLFIQYHQRKLRELAFDFASDSFVSPDLTILSENVTGDGLVEMAFQQEPDSVVWAARNDGVLAGLTYLRDQEVVAWHEHVIGGVSGAATITVTDFSNIATGTKLVFTKSDGTTVTVTCQGAGTGTPDANKFFHNSSNNATADNLFTLLNGLDDFTVANPAANVVTVEETTRTGTGFLSITTGDTTRLAVTSQSHALVESVITIPGDKEDELWMSVQRTIDGATRRFVEVMTPKFDTFRGSTQDGAVFVDSSLSFAGTASSTLSGLDHLEGEDVSILGDGSVYPNQAVSSGGVSSISPAVEAAAVGLPYTSTLKTLRPEKGGDDGSAQGRTKRVFETTFRFLDTLGAEYAPGTSNNFDTVQFRRGSTPMDSAPPLFSGDKTVQFHGSWETEGQAIVRQTQPLPFEVTSIVTRVVTHSG